MPTPAEVASLIQSYENGATCLLRWTAGLSDGDLASHPVPGTWSIRQLVVHMLDSDLAAGHRFRRVVAEDVPLIIAYDETRFAANCQYEQADIPMVCELFRVHRLFHSRWLRTVPEQAWERAGVHNQRGKVSLAQFVALYIGHVTHHEQFLVEKRRALGKPLS